MDHALWWLFRAVIRRVLGWTAINIARLRAIALPPIPPPVPPRDTVRLPCPQHVTQSLPYDRPTILWVERVLSGNNDHPFPLCDPEAEHDSLRLRGVLSALADVFAMTGCASVIERMERLIAHTCIRADDNRSVGWDTTTAALRLVSMLEAVDRVSDANGSLRLLEIGWLPAFAEAHQTALRIGRLVEPSGNHRFVNVVGTAALHLLVYPGVPLPPAICRQLASELDAQFLHDGGHIEHTPHYHVQVLALAAAIEAADTRRGGKLRPALEPMLRRALEPLQIISQPTGGPVRFGDAGRTFSGRRRDVEVAMLLRDSTFARFGREVAPAVESGVLPSFGCRRVRWRARTAVLDLYVDVGPLGLRQNPGHGHADALSFCLFVAGEPLIADPGTFLYADTARALWFKRQEAHSIVYWPHAPAHEPSGFFRWRRTADAPRTFDAGSPVSFTATQHWRSRGHSFCHARTWRATARGLVISDDIYASDGLPAHARIHLHPDVDVVSLINSTAHFRVGGRGVRVRMHGRWEQPPAITPAEYAPDYGMTRGSQCMHMVAGASRRQRLETAFEVE